MKKQLQLLGFFMLASLAVFAQPTANFSNTPDMCNPLQVAFTDGSTNAVTWQWDFGDGSTDATQNPNHLFSAAGQYTVMLVVMDTNQTTDTAMVQLTLVNGIMATTTSVDESAQGANDGSASATAAGGVAPYTYLWNNGATAANISNLAGGTYCVTVTDGNGCATSSCATVNVGQATAPIGQFAPSIGMGCGPLTVQFTDQSTNNPTSWAWDFGDGNTSTVQNPVHTFAVAGAYTVQVTATNAGGSGTGADQITVYASPTVAMSSTDESAQGACDGSMTATVTGGSAPYAYLWTDSMNTASVSNMCAGSQSVQVTDMNGCITNGTAVVNTAQGQFMAQFSQSATSGCGPLTIQFTDLSNGAAGWAWDFGDGTTSQDQNPTHTYSTAGTYAVMLVSTDSIVSDTATGSVVVSPGLSLTMSATDVSAQGSCDGSASVAVTGGSAPYAYAWSDSSAAATAVNLCEGVITVQVLDANGCTGNGTAMVNAPAGQFMAQFSQSTTSGCGPLTVQFTDLSNGAAGWDWNFGDGTTSQDQNPTHTFTNAGTYTVILVSTDSIVSDTATGTVTVGAGLSVAISATNESADGACDGSATATVTGGVAPYSYNWSNSSVSATVIDLCAGVYQLDVVDANGCSGNGVATVATDSSGTPGLQVGVQMTNTSCGGQCDGTASLTVVGGAAPYTYLWSDGSTSATLIGACAGTYDYVVTDGNGVNNTGYVIIMESSAMTIMADSNGVTTAACGNADGSIGIDVNGGTPPYVYNWDNGATSATLSNVAGGMYTVNVTDANGCASTFSLVVPNTSGPTVTVNGTTDANCGGNDGSIDISISGGTAPYSVMWDNGVTAEDMLDAPAGIHYVEVVDANGCVGSASATIGSTGTNAPSISGNVTTSNGFTVVDGIVMIYANDPYQLQMNNVAVTTIDNQGNYFFSSILPVGEYIIKAIPSQALYPNAIATFFGLTHMWDSAAVVTAACDQDHIVNLEVIDLTPLGGSSTFGGTIASSVNGKNAMAGDPIPGIDVSLEQIPGGIVATATTDVDGRYEFLSVPTGSTFTYEIHVDIPGLPMDETYTLNTDQTSTTENDLDFLVDLTSIFIDDAATSVNPLAEEAKLMVFPNPTSDVLNITAGTAITNVTIVDVTGKLVLIDQVSNTTKSISLGHLDNGVYFVNIQVNGTTVVKKMTKN